jgi:glycosyltransferase involved in cell wall biosynthesis
MVGNPGPRMRILHVLLSIGETSAPYNEHCLATADRRDLAICTYFRPPVTPPPGVALFTGDGSPIGFMRALRAALTRTRHDIVHVHAPQVALFLLMASAWIRHGTAGATVYTVHNSFGNYKLRNRALLLPPLACFQRIVCCSQVARDSLPAFYQRLAGRRLRVVPNGVDLDRVDRILGDVPAARPAAPFTVASVSQLIERKNPLAVLEAFHEADDGVSRLVLIGQGPLHDRLVAEGRARGVLARLEFTGLIARERVYGRLRQADVFVSASRGEGLPVAVLEAMACRCPVILSDIPPHREVAAGADFIPLVAPDDASGFAREIRRLRGLSARQRAAIGEECRRIAERRFSLGAMHRAYEEVYAEVLREAPPARKLTAHRA